MEKTNESLKKHKVFDKKTNEYLFGVMVTDEFVEESGKYDYFWFMYDKDYYAENGEGLYKNIRDIILARIFYLATFLDEEANKLVKDDGTPIKVEDIPGILGYKRIEIANEVCDAMVSEGIAKILDDGIYFNRDVFTKKKTAEQLFYPSIKIYTRQMKCAYSKDSRLQIKLSSILRVLPFLGQNNVLCWDVYEEDIYNSEPLTKTEIADIAGVSDYGRFVMNGLAFRTWYKDHIVCEREFDNGDRFTAIHPWFAEQESAIDFFTGYKDSKKYLEQEEIYV